MIAIHTFATQGETLAIGNALEAAGIGYLIEGDDAMPSVAFSEGGIHLLVNEEDADRAREVLAGAISIGEIIEDPAFLTAGDADSPWQLQQHGTVRLSVCREDDSVKIVQTGAAGVNWHGEFRYAPFAVRKGETLRLNFEARADKEMGFAAWIGQYREPWASLVPAEQHFGIKDLSPEWQAFELTAQMLSDEPETRLNFVLGACDNTIWFRGISLARIS